LSDKEFLAHLLVSLTTHGFGVVVVTRYFYRQQDNYQNGCGGFGGEYFWYMGRTQCFKANVAYALYGHLKGSSNTGCTKLTYINSFFTTFGAESFAGPLGLGIDYGNSQCTIDETPNNVYLDNSALAADDDYLDDKYPFYNYQAYTSIGTGCSDKKQFVTDSYTGAFCHGQNYVETIDTLSDFNSKLQGMECTQIYDGSQQPQSFDNDGDYNFAKMYPIDLLSFSKSCSLRQYPHDCPDPHGVKRKYAATIDGAFFLRTGGNRDIGRRLMGYVTYVFAALGVLLLIMALVIRRRLVPGNGRGSSSKKSNNRSSSSSTTSSYVIKHKENKKDRRRTREGARREKQTKERQKTKDKDRKSRSTTPKSAVSLNAVARSLSRSQSRESSRSDSKRSSSAPAGALAMLGAGGGGNNSGNDYEAPQWTAFGGSGGDDNKSKGGKATKMEEVTTVRSSSGTVSIAITETINTACNSLGMGGENDNRRSTKAGSFSKFFRSGSNHSIHL
jgi:hypothetical protein